MRLCRGRGLRAFAASRDQRISAPPRLCAKSIGDRPALRRIAEVIALWHLVPKSEIVSRKNRTREESTMATTTTVDVNREIAAAERVADHVVDADQHVNPPP